MTPACSPRAAAARAAPSRTPSWPPSARRLPPTSPEAGRVPVDWAGAGLLLVTMTVLAITLDYPHDTTSEAIMPIYHRWLAGPALAGALGFVVVERRSARGSA